MSRGFYDVMDAALGTCLTILIICALLASAAAMVIVLVHLGNRLSLRIKAEERLCPRCKAEKELLRPCDDCGCMIESHQVDCGTKCKHTVANYLHDDTVPQ